MTRTIVAAAFCALACAFSPVVQAQNSVLYGLVDVSGSRVKPVGGGGGRWQLDSGNLSRSFLGFRGSEDLGGGLRAVFKLESYLGVDTGTAGRFSGDPFFAREASVGLSGAFGTTVLGRTPSPLYLATVSFNPFGEAPGFSPSTRQYFGGVVLGDTRWSNSMMYVNSGRDAPLRINLAANVPEQGPGSLSTGRNIGGSIAYLTGPFAATFAIERIKNSLLPLPAGFNRQLAMQAGASYDFSLVRVYGQIGRVHTRADTDERTTLWQLGASVPLGNSLILASYGHAHTRTSVSGLTTRTFSIGYDYFLSKNTDIYVAALHEKLSFVESGHAIAGGVRLRF
jgi:predicted porin